MMIWMKGLLSSRLLSGWIIRLGLSGCWQSAVMLNVLRLPGPLRLSSSGAFLLMGSGLWFCDSSRCAAVWLRSYRVGLSLISLWFAPGCSLTALAFPCILSGLLASPLCGAAPTFFAAAKKVGKESGLPTA